MVVASIAFVLLATSAWAFKALPRIAATGAAYKAKVLATALFGAGRTIDPRRAPEVSADSYRPMRLFRTAIDREARTVSVWLPGFAPRVAWYRSPALGACVVAPGVIAAPPRPAVFRDDAHSVSPAVHDGPASPLQPPASPAAPAWPQASPRSPQLDAFIASAFEETRRWRRRRTRAIVVLRRGRLIAERYAPGFDASSLMPGWSMTKAVMGTLAGILVGQGRLRLDANELMPGWEAPDPRGAISLEDLLRMRTGLRFDENYRDLRSDVNEMLFHQPDMAAYAASRPLDAPPGTSWGYSSGTTNVLAAVIRRAVGEADYAGWPHRALFDPIGMRSARLEADAAGTFVGSSYMLATARDWARFGQLYLQDGIWDGLRVLPDGWVRFATTATPQAATRNWGAHWYLKLNADIGGASDAAAKIAPDAYFAIGHEGQTLTVIPSLHLVVVRLGLSIHIDAWNHAEFIAGLQDVLE